MFFLKNVKDKERVSCELKIWANIFHVLNFAETQTTLLKIKGRQTCYFIQ